MTDEEYLNQRLDWVMYRFESLDQMEKKLIEMKQLAEYARDNKLSSKQVQSINTKLRKYQQEVIEMDENSKTFWLDNQ